MSEYIHTAPKGFPKPQGLYDSRHEHDACGIGFIANIKNNKSHDIVKQGLQLLVNLTHRGAVGADPKAGDGAGILLQIPDQFYREECAKLGFELPAAGEYGVGTLFLPQDTAQRAECEQILEGCISIEGQTLLGWRDMPVDNSDLGKSVLATEPFIRQVFIGQGDRVANTDTLERKLFVIRKRASRETRAKGEEYIDFYIP